MGSDDLFKKRRQAAQEKLARKGPKRDPYDRVLIVCEGAKTEPNYLQELVDYYGLNTANVEVDGRSGSSPDKVFEYAKSCYQTEKNKGDAYDRVYCVIDKDSHATYDATVRTIASTDPKDTFFAITSVPCFEYWVLLHYQPITHPYVRTQRKSPCDCVISELKVFIPDYAKGNKGVFGRIMEQTDFAIANSKRALEQARRADIDNPTTLMHELVMYLRDLKSNTEES